MAMRKIFDLSFFKSVWFQRILSIFEKESVLVGKTPQLKAKPVVTPVKREMHSSATKLASVRIPLIKFVGARLPRPHFDGASLPPLVVSGNFSAPTIRSASASSIGPVGKIPRGQGIEWQQLPAQFRRDLISEEEIDAVNTGFSYNH